LLSNDGRRNDTQIIPLDFLLSGTDANQVPKFFTPRIAAHFFEYGYQTWFFPFKVRTFALQGIHGQVVLVQTSSKIVMVQTAVFNGASG
jgi:hypothetical protein